MITLAMELSTHRGSAALIIGDEHRSEIEWEAGRKSGDKLFQSVSKLMSEAGTDLEQVDTFAVGRGPGSYSGLRVTMTAANAFALPAKRKVFSISSGEAMAAQCTRDHEAEHILVIGDARRSSLWMGHYTAGQDAPMEWHVMNDPEALPVLPPGTRLVSSDWDRIANSPLLARFADQPRDDENRYPHAGMIAELVVNKLQRDLPSEPLTPIYTQPPVLAPKA